MNILRKIREVDRALNQGLISYQEAADAVAPFTDAEPVRHGRWVNHLSENGATDGTFCSRCDYEIERYSRPNYCPNCGAKMDEAEVIK